MIAHETVINYITPLGVTDEMRDAARLRAGEWEVVTMDWDTEYKWFDMWGAEEVMKETNVKFTEKEIPRILHIFTHGYRNKTKLESIHANLEQAAETWWPSGSLEHVAMRTLGVPLLVRVFAGHRLELPPTFMQRAASSICCLPIRPFFERTVLRRRCVQPTGASIQNDGDDANPKKAEEHKLKRTDTSTFVSGVRKDDDKEDDDDEDCPVGLIDSDDEDDNSSTQKKMPKHGGNTPEDAGIIAN